jgi:hypothetical protein
LAATLSGARFEAVVRHGPAISAVLASFVNVLGFGPTLTKAWARPHSDSVTVFLLNSVKFIPSFFALDTLSIATCAFPATLVVANAAVAAIIYLRRLYASSPAEVREETRAAGAAAGPRSSARREIL